MGYYTQVTGEIAIAPPIKWGDINGSPFLPDSGEWTDVVLRVAEDSIDTDEGTLTRRSCAAIEPATDDGYKAYGIQVDLQTLLNAIGPGHEYSGYLEGLGEDNEDIWRLYVRDGKAIKVKVQLVWPEGTPG